MRYVFENFILDVEKHELRQDGDQVAVEPQVFALLIHLIEQRERVVSKEELIEAIWEGRFVSDSVVSSRIKSARKALGDDGRTQQYIKTLHGTGFRFIAPVTTEAAHQKTDEQPPLADIEIEEPANDRDDRSTANLTDPNAEPISSTIPVKNFIKPIPMAILIAAILGTVAIFLLRGNQSGNQTDVKYTFLAKNQGNKQDE